MSSQRVLRDQLKQQINHLSQNEIEAKLDRSPGSVERELLVSRLRDQARLRRYATIDPVWQVRRQAVRLVNDLQTLDQVATNELNKNVRDVANQRRVNMIRKLTDLDEMIHYATSDPSGLVRQAAVGCIHGQQRLEQIALTDNDERVKLAAVANITDQQALLRLTLAWADNGLNWRLWNATIDALKDKSVLVEIATLPMTTDEEDYPYQTVKAAAQRLIQHGVLRTDDDLVFVLEHGNLGDDVRSRLMRVIRDPKILADFALRPECDHDEFVSLIARITVPSEFARAIGNSDSEHLVSLWDSGAVANQPVLQELLRDRLVYLDDSVGKTIQKNRRRAKRDKTIVKYVSNVVVVGIYALSAYFFYKANVNIVDNKHRYWSVTFVLFEVWYAYVVIHAKLRGGRFSGEELWHRAYKRGFGWRIRYGAIERTQDQELLMRVAQHDRSYKVRVMAINKLEDSALLHRIATAGRKKVEREAAELALNEANLGGVVYQNRENGSILLNIFQKNGGFGPVSALYIESVMGYKRLFSPR